MIGVNLTVYFPIEVDANIRAGPPETKVGQVISKYRIASYPGFPLLQLDAIGHKKHYSVDSDLGYVLRRREKPGPFSHLSLRQITSLLMTIGVRLFHPPI